MIGLCALPEVRAAAGEGVWAKSGAHEKDFMSTKPDGEISNICSVSFEAATARFLLGESEMEVYGFCDFCGNSPTTSCFTVGKGTSSVATDAALPSSSGVVADVRCGFLPLTNRREFLSARGFLSDRENIGY